jgi:hypothetical protein
MNSSQGSNLLPPARDQQPDWQSCQTNKRETDMIRNTLIAVAAVAVIGTVALAPTAASAKHFGGFGHHHHGFFGGFSGWVDPGYDDGCYLVKKPTRYGYRWVTVCT